MTVQWSKLDDETYVASVNEQTVAVVYFLGGHCERPDAWYVRDNREYAYSLCETDSLKRAQSIVEEQYAHS